ncbi:MAG: PAS domain-containing protein [Alphaproteobacteria bacterium]|nr:PAS domain-containing protein [Alphaproteobacteria bacterium]
MNTVDTGLANHWVNMDTGLRFKDPRLEELHRYWLKKCGNRLMPVRRDIEPLELKSHMGRLHFIDVEHDPIRLRYRLIGTVTTETLGRDMTGRYFDEI